MFKKAFTLVELLVVIAIIAVIAGIAFPAFGRARQDARRTTSISNLRQCGLALQMYCEDYGGYTAMPSGQIAEQVLKTAPTCDPSDTWRSSCSQQFGPPLVGSYAYVRYVLSEQEWLSWTAISPNMTVMISIYYADNVPSPFHGLTLDVGECITGKKQCQSPNRVLRLHLDGSVKANTEPVTFNNNIRLLSWPELFISEYPHYVLVPGGNKGP